MRNTNWLKILGPGILFAGTAIGVSHLVQSTRAGADYGYTLLWAIILANFFKYPFFEFGSRYAQATQTSLLVGYKKMGSWQLWLYFGITIISMFPVTAAVSFVTVSFLGAITGFSSSAGFASQAIGLFLFCVVILAIGRYKALDKTVKVIAALMLLSIIVVMIALAINPVAHPQTPQVLPIWQDSGQLIFVIALMGWMPTAVDLSTWSSIWTVESMRETKFIPTLKQTLNEFRVGYLISAVTAILFLILGAELMFYSGDTFPDAPAGFSTKLISLFTTQIGEWSFILIAIAGLGVMFSTTITVFDGYARAMSEASELLKKNSFFGRYNFWLLITASGGMLLILVFLNQLKGLVDMATTISFLVAPLVAYLNYKLVNSTALPVGSQPNRWFNYWALSGLAFLVGFAVLFLFTALR